MLQEDVRTMAELREVESRLRGVGPVDHGINRDMLMFEAGKASASNNGRRDVRLWQGAFGMMVGVCAGMAVMGVGRSRTVEKAPTAQDTGGSHATLVQQGTGNTASGPAADFGMSSAAGATGMGGAQMTYLQTRQEIFNGSLAPAGNATGADYRGYSPVLQSNDGLNALPDWQKRALLFPGDR